MGSVQTDITDPSDWIVTSLPSLSSLDSALRCQVCKEFYDTPMITSCSHTFCSLCIRRCLSADGKCPTCRAGDQQSKLRRNWAVQEVVEGWKEARRAVLEVARKDEAEDGHKRKRRKIDSQSDGTKPAETAHATRTRSSARISGRQSAPASQEVVVVDSDDDAEYLPDAPPEPEEPNDGLVACPMCNTRMKEEFVFSHLDKCDGQPPKEKKPAPPKKKPSDFMKVPASPSKQLSHLNYNLLKDTALKKKMQDAGIPTWGNRQLLVRRHTQWVDIFNANSDSLTPKSNRELLKDLDVWERAQGGHAPGQGQTGPTGVMRKDFNGTEWTGKHKSQFDDLIAQARAKRKNVQPKAEEKEGEKKPDEMNGTEPPPPAPSLPKLDTEALPGSTPTPTPSKDITSSPVASMLQSAAQDLRRRSSISSASGAVPGLISMHSIPSIHSGASTPLRESQTPLPGLQTALPKPVVPLQQESLTDSRRTSDTLAEKMATSLAGDSASESGVKRVPMFQVPEAPVVDVEGFGGQGEG